MYLDQYLKHVKACGQFAFKQSLNISINVTIPNTFVREVVCVAIQHDKNISPGFIIQQPFYDK